ncbi:394_t:CDS:2 [Entrophospora sp. SA101]|nr:394_t:CDS:2 [Entrophospora sp. SA101]
MSWCACSLDTPVAAPHFQFNTNKSCHDFQIFKDLGIDQKATNDDVDNDITEAITTTTPVLHKDRCLVGIRKS